MKFSFLIVQVFFFLTSVTASWSKEDQEIFRLRDEVEASEGLGVTFYDFLGTKPSANQDEINKAYRKKSRILHPDKVKQQLINEGSSTRRLTQIEIKARANEASDRFARLGIVANILRGSGRDRYNHFLKYGFPKWKNTGYYYVRFRPGLTSVLIGLFIFVGGAGHWIVLYLSWKRHVNFINHYIRFARHSALGESIPGLENSLGSTSSTPTDVQFVNRRQRRIQGKDSKKEKKPKVKKPVQVSSLTTSDMVGPRKRVVAENGKILVIDSVGNVYLEHIDEDGESNEFLLDPNELQKPNFYDTALVRTPLWICSFINTQIFRHAPVTKLEPEIEDDIDAANSSSGDNFELLENVKKTAENGTGRIAHKKKSQKRK